MILFLNYTFDFMFAPSRTISKMVEVDEKRFNRNIRYRNRLADKMAKQLLKELTDAEKMFICGYSLTFTKD